MWSSGECGCLFRAVFLFPLVCKGEFHLRVDVAPLCSKNETMQTCAWPVSSLPSISTDDNFFYRAYTIKTIQAASAIYYLAISFFNFLWKSSPNSRRPNRKRTFMTPHRVFIASNNSLKANLLEKWKFLTYSTSTYKHYLKWRKPSLDIFFYLRCLSLFFVPFTFMENVGFAASHQGATEMFWLYFQDVLGTLGYMEIFAVLKIAPIHSFTIPYISLLK